MKIDSIYFAVFSFAQLFLFSALGMTLFPDFLASYNFVIWAVVSAIGFAVYPWLRSSLYPERLRFTTVLARLAVIFALSIALSFVIIGCIASDQFVDWQLGLFFIAVPSAAASAVALLISYAVLRLSHNPLR